MIRSHNTDYTLNFYNDRVREIVASEIIAEPFTYIPITAGQMEVLSSEEGDAIAFGKIVEGYDVFDINVVPEITYEDVGEIEPEVSIDISPLEISRTTTINPIITCNERRTITAVLAITLPDQIYEGFTYMVNVRMSSLVSYGAVYVANPGDTIADVKANWSTAMTLAGIEVTAGSPYNKIYIFQAERGFCNDPYESGDASDVYPIAWGWSYYAFVLTEAFSTLVNNLKCGATHGFGIVYKDKAGRACSVMKTALMNVVIPFYTEPEGQDINQRPVINFEINHKPPDWADTYEIVYFGNISMNDFFQCRIDQIIDLSGFGLVGFYGANIQATIDATRARNTRWKFPNYGSLGEWQEGDRIRLIGTIDEEDPGAGDFTKYTELYDYEITDIGTEYGEAIGGDFLYFQVPDPDISLDGETNIIAEVYRPCKGLGVTTPYGCGMVFEIGIDENGHRYHKGDVDQIINEEGAVESPAEVLNTANDSYKFLRLNYLHESSSIFPFWAESTWPSDWWSWITSNKLTVGFPFLFDINQKQTALDERIRNGGFIVTGSRTNNLAHFVYDGFLDLPKQNGDITGMKQVGYTLKVLQLYKETSIYINRIVNFNADGSENITLTNALLGTIYPMSTDYGCQHPDSIMVNGRNLYYWDNSEGAFIRSAPNGQINLSGAKYKVSRWFKDVVKWLRASGGVELAEIHTGANNEHEEVWLTFRIGGEVHGMIFSEKDGRFKSRINQPTEAYVHLGSFFAHMYRQRLWIMSVDAGQDYLTWVGTPVYAKFEIASNIQPEKNKIFKAVALYSDHQWESESKTVMIPEEASAVNEKMETNISVWDRREGIFYGKILKDENSRGNFVSVNHKKLNGRSMRGRYSYLEFKTEEHTEKVRLDMIVVFSIESERSL